MSNCCGLRLLAALAVLACVLLFPRAVLAVEVHLGDDSLLTASTAPPDRPKLPVLFVHGHNTTDDDTDFNYKKNWWDDLNTLPSFKRTLEANLGLGIEAYYIRFEDQDRSIDLDANEIQEAVDLILQRHDPDGSGTVRVAIVAYSKGTISTRKFLKNLSETPSALNPISTFVAIAPPNHGISTNLFAVNPGLSTKQLYNGYRPQGLVFDCGDSFNDPASTDYIENLNGHPIEDTLTLGASDVYPGEAPGSRAPGDPPLDGTLYVTLFADGNRDFVGGETASGDCQGRTLALNLSPDAVNIALGTTSITGSSETAVHQNTVHSVDVMCLALFAARYNRSPEGQTCQAASGVPIIPSPARAAAMLTLDFSGSMAAQACATCDSRAQILKDATALFIQLWASVGDPDDRIGVTYFRRDIDQHDIAGALLPSLADGAEDVIDDIGSQSPGSLTAMGGGLQRSIEALEPLTDAEIRRVILFTDGMQNVNPMILPVGNHHEIVNEAGRINSNVMPSVPPKRLDQLPGIAIDTIGVGAGNAFTGQLSDIAGESGGRTWVTTAPDDQLREFFVEELINALRGFSPQLIDYRRGAIGSNGSNESFVVEGGARKLVLKLSWRRGQDMTIRVEKDGADVTGAGRIVSGAFYKIFAIDFSAKGPGGALTSQGTWRLAIGGKAGARYEAAAIADTERVMIDASFAARSPIVGEPLAFEVRTIIDGKAFSGKSKVDAILQRPAVAAGGLVADRKQIESVRNLEPGMSMAEQASLALTLDPRTAKRLRPITQRMDLSPAAEGVYRGSFRPTVPGIYTVVVSIEGDDERTGRFLRRATVMTVVGPGPADAKNSRITRANSGLSKDRRYVTLVVTPRNAGNVRLGPGYADSISVKLSRGRTIGGAQDLGDGRYMLVLAVAANSDADLTLGMGGVTLYAGPLSRIARSAAP